MRVKRSGKRIAILFVLVCGSMLLLKTLLLVAVPLALGSSPRLQFKNNPEQQLLLIQQMINYTATFETNHQLLSSGFPQIGRAHV